MRVTWAWCLLAFITALATSYNCSTVASRQGLRWIEGVGQAVATALVALMVRQLLIQLAHDFQMNVEIPPVWRVTTNSLFAGFVIGVSVPTWFRRRRKHRRVELESYHSEPLAA